MEDDDIVKVKSLEQGDTLLSGRFSGKFDSSEKYFLSDKLNTSLKFQLISNLDFIDDHFIFFTFIKYLIGFIFLVVPFLIIIIFVIIDYDQRYKYMSVPYFISISALIGSLIILLVIKLTDTCRTTGFLLKSWERINAYRIIKMICITFFVLWFLFLFESFIINLNVLKEKVAQSYNKQSSSKIFDRGTYEIRIFFILLLWSREKDENGKYIYENIGYFEYEGTFFEDFHNALDSLFIPIIILCILTLIKIFFIKTKNELFYGSLCIVTIIKSFIFIYYPITNETKSQNNIAEETSYFTNTSIKYIEVVCDYLIILILLLFNGKIFIIKLINKKYYSYKTKKKIKSIFISVMVAFAINVLGYILLIILLSMLYFCEIDENLSIYRYYLYWALFYISITFILIGYAFPFGNLCLNLIYHPTEFEVYEHDLKNKFYKKCTYNLRINSLFHIEAEPINSTKSMF